MRIEEVINKCTPKKSGSLVSLFAGISGVLRYTPWMFRKSLGKKFENWVPECVIWLQLANQEWWEQLGNFCGLVCSIASLLNTGFLFGNKDTGALACVIDIFGTIWNIGCMSYELYSIWGYRFRTEANKKVVLEEIIQKMEESLGIIGGFAAGPSRNSKNVTWQVFNSVQQQVRDLQANDLLDKFNLIEERLAEWRGE